MTRVECPECGEQFEVDSNLLFLLNRFYCSACDAMLEVIEEDPLVLDVIEEEFLDDDEDVDADGWDAD